MKKLFLSAMMATAFLFGANAQTVITNDYGSPITGADGQSVSNDDENESIGYYGLGFYSYDGGENYSLSFGNYTFNGVGIGVNIRSNFKFSDNQNTYNGDVLINYSLGVYKNSDTKVMVTAEAGPSFASRYVYDDGKVKDKFFVDAFVGIKGTVSYKKFVLSAGYHIWAPKFKFGKDYKADGFYAQLGISI